MEQLRLLRINQVLRRTGLKRTSFYRKVADGEFPPPVKIGAHSSAWVEAEVSQWIAAKIEASRAGR